MLNQDLLAQATQQNPHAILMTDLSGNIVYINGKFSALTGYAFEEVVGKNPRIFSSGETPAAIYRSLWETVLSGRTWQGELLNKRKNGQVFWESISISPIRDGQGKISHYIGVWNDVTKRKKDEEEKEKSLKEFEHQSRTDDLTGQYNRRHIFVELEKEVERASRYTRRLSGMMIDIDDFKLINDRYGHPIGDRVIKTFSTVISKSIRKIDILGRYGGDEFLVILPEATLDMANLVARRIQKNLEVYQQNVLFDFGKLTASIGLISLEAIQVPNQKAFIERIDSALLKSKQAGKNTITMG